MREYSIALPKKTLVAGLAIFLAILVMSATAFAFINFQRVNNIDISDSMSVTPKEAQTIPIYRGGIGSMEYIVENLSEEEMDVGVSHSALPIGVTCDIETDNFTLSPGASQIVFVQYAASENATDGSVFLDFTNNLS